MDFAIIVLHARLTHLANKVKLFVDNFVKRLSEG